MPPRGRGRGRGAAAKAAKRAQGRRRTQVVATQQWRDPTVGGKKLRNVHYTQLENERLLQAVKAFCVERGLDEEGLKQSLRDEKQKGKTWGRIAALCGANRRSVQSLTQHLRRLLFGRIRWSQEQTEMLTEAVTSCEGVRPSWKQIAERVGASPEQCKDKWKGLCGATKKGLWGALEVWALRQGICELTGSLAPVCNVPWPRVQHWVPHRSGEQCRQMWFKYVLPQLLQYQDKHGLPIDTDVFHRLILRKLKKSRAQDVGDVNWQRVNGWWSASLNRAHWRKLEMRAPKELREASLPELVAWLSEALDCEGHRKRDRRVLKHARLVLEAQAAGESDEEAEEAGERERPGEESEERERVLGAEEDREEDEEGERESGMEDEDGKQSGMESEESE